MVNISFAPFCSFLIELSESESTISEDKYDPFEEDKDVLFERFNELLDRTEDPDVLLDKPELELVPSLCTGVFRIGLLCR